MDIYKPTDEQQNQFIWKDPLPSIIDFGRNLRRMGLVNVVELGCRVGGHAIGLSELGLNVTAVDRNKNNLNIVSGRALSKQCKIETIHQASTRLPFEDNTVHAFVTSTAIHHLSPSKAKEMVNEMYRTLIPGGRIIIAVLSVEDYRYGTGKKIDENTFENTVGPEIKNIHQFFTEESLLDLFNSFTPECKPYSVSSTYTLNMPNSEKKQGKLLIGKFIKGISSGIQILKTNVMLDNLKNAKRSIELHFTYSTINRNEFTSSCLKFLEFLTVNFLENVYCQCIVIGNCPFYEVPILKKLREFEGIASFSLAYSEHNTETQSLDIAIIDGVMAYSCTHSENFSESALIFKSDPEFIIFLRQHLTSCWKKSTILIDNGKRIQNNDFTIQSMDNNSHLESSVEIINLKSSKKNYIRVGIAQIELTEILHFDNNIQLLKPDLMKLSNTIDNILLKAANINLDLLLLPELSGDISLNQKLQAYSTDNNIVIIGGSYYNNLRVNCCPVFIPGMSNPYVIEKIHPSPLELSPNKNSGAVGGKKTIVFKNTIVGSFGVLICADFLNDALVEDICKNEIDFLCVLSMNNGSDRFFEKMNSRCHNCQIGIYILYSNCLFHTDTIIIEGLSSIFGFMDRIYLNKLKRDETKYPCQIASFSSNEGEGLLIADINLNEKRPGYLTPESKPNISDIDKILFNGNKKLQDELK